MAEERGPSSRHDAPTSHRLESLADRRIREAMERGDFDDLPGAGKPLPDAGQPYDEMWWVKKWIAREQLKSAVHPGDRRVPDQGSGG